MKKLLSIFLITGFTVLLSCDDTVESDLYDQGPNVAGFVNASQAVNTIADGTVYSFQLQMEVKGPRIDEVTGDITATIAADPSSEAIEGTHFNLTNSTVTLAADNNHLALFDFEVLTAGVEAPAQIDAVLIVSQASGDNNVDASQKVITVTINYGCPSDLAGTYNTTIVRDDGNVYNYTETISELALNTYRGESVGRWTPGSIGGTPGFTFVVVCGEINVPQQNLVDLYSNQVTQEGPSYVDELTGDIHIEYRISSSGWTNAFVADYVKQ